MKIIPIGNHICGRNGCDKEAKKKIDFELGFSAGFCENCASNLQRLGLTTKVTNIT
jgi:hypothetical protein